MQNTSSFEVPFGFNYKILPLTYTEFKEKFKIKGTAVTPYRQYLEVNAKSHHYGDFESLDAWYVKQIM